MTINNQIEISEVREMIDETLQENISVHSKNRSISTENRNIDQALLSLVLNTNTDNLDVNDKQFSLLYGNSTTEPDEKLIDNKNIKKRHIMISYNRSSIRICRKIYHRLVERNYKVWIDLDHMFDDVLVAMARAVENSYIVLLCINQEYYESNYCRLEAEYAAEKRIKFIPCLMEESFHPKSWLGIIIKLFIYYSNQILYKIYRIFRNIIQRNIGIIIKGSNVHIDFSCPNDFDESFEQLIRQITFVERKLSLQPRKNNVNSIIRRNQLLSNEQILQEFLSLTLEQNELLLKLIDHLTRKQNRRHNFDVNNIIKTILTIVLLCSLIIYCQKL